MRPVAKALWYIESHYAQELSLDDVAEASGVSRYYMARAFAVSTGLSVMRYVRGRRLSEAAKALSNGASDILNVALDAGYSSHEAFTRAFRDQFGLTPEALRTQHRLDGIQLIEAMRIDPARRFELGEPRIEQGSSLSVVGLNARYSYESNGAGIPAQWQRFAPHIGNVRGQISSITWGVCHNTDETGMDYLSGVEVSDSAETPPELTRIDIAPQCYAIFIHRDHVSAIKATLEAIWSDWLPPSGYRVADAPDLERYGADFNPQTGGGGFELWLPIVAA